MAAFLGAAAAGVPEAWLSAGLAHEELDDWPASESAYRQAIAADDPRGRLPGGDLWRWHGDGVAAERLWRQAADGRGRPLRRALARWLLLRGLTAEEEPLLRQAVDVDDDARSPAPHAR